MALFKIAKGNKSNLPIIKTDGYAYFTTDDGTFYIDHGIVRTMINPNADWNSVDGTSMIMNKPFTIEKIIDGSDEILNITFI